MIVTTYRQGWGKEIAVLITKTASGPSHGTSVGLIDCITRYANFALFHYCRKRLYVNLDHARSTRRGNGRVHSAQHLVRTQEDRFLHHSSSSMFSLFSIIPHFSNWRSSSKGSSLFHALISHSCLSRPKPRSYTPGIFSMVHTMRRPEALT